jgi:membrane protein
MDPERSAPIPEAARQAPGGPASPLRISASGWRATVTRTIGEIREDRITITAAGVAFYWFLAVFPLLFAGIALLAIVDASPSFVAGVVEAIRTALPGEAATILTDSVTASQDRAADAASLAAALLAIGVALWSASSGMAATQVGLDVAYDVEEDRPFVKKRLIALALLVMASVLGGVAVAMVVFAEPIGEVIRERLPAGSTPVWVWTVGRWALAFAAVTTLIAILYWIGPNRRPPSWRWLTPGGIVATALWIGASAAFAFVTSHLGGSYARTYGALAGVVLLLLWLYLTALAILVGAELNGEFERQRAALASKGSRVPLP